MGDAAFERRLALFLERHGGGSPGGAARTATSVAGSATVAGRSAVRHVDLAENLAAALDGQVVETPTGRYVRVERPSRAIPVDRGRLAGLPGQPPVGAPLVCLDTETTGLGTATGTYVFLLGLGWWQGDDFRQVQLLLSDHADEPAMLEAFTSLLPPNAWLVTYNGRGFDWPLLVTRFRMRASPPPAHAGHLDLLGIVRRVFRHRLADARLRTVESSLLGMTRPGDVEGWQIPSRYLSFLHDGDPSGLVEVARHNDQDVRSLARLVALLERRYGDPRVRGTAPAGDLAGLARAFTREHRLVEALDCVEAALASPDPAGRDPFGRTPSPRRSSATDPEGADADERGDPWWAPRRRPDIGGHGNGARPILASPTLAGAWTTERIALERARLLRRLSRVDDALAAWRAIGVGGGHLAAAALIEVAKLEEHAHRDPAAALAAVDAAASRLERSRGLGQPWPGLELDILHRRRRLRRRAARTASPVGSLDRRPNVA
jgi:hypothetical protein